MECYIEFYSALIPASFTDWIGQQPTNRSRPGRVPGAASAYAGVAVNAGKAAMRISALDNLFLHRAPQPVLRGTLTARTDVESNEAVLVSWNFAPV